MFEKIQAYLASQLDIPADEITRDTTFESLGVDSLDTVEMVMDLEEQLGVDLEQIRPVRPRLERALTAAERQWLASLPQPERDEGFFRLWTLKESWIKCRDGRLAEFRRAEFLLRGREIVSAPPGFVFRYLPAPAGYVLAVCEKG